VAQRVGRGIAVLFLGGPLGPMAGLGRRKISSPPGFDPAPSCP